jgi:hypothetical protein
MLMASFCNRPVTPVLPIRSEPERSTRWTRATVFTSDWAAREIIWRTKIQ